MNGRNFAGDKRCEQFSRDIRGYLLASIHTEYGRDREVIALFCCERQCNCDPGPAAFTIRSGNTSTVSARHRVDEGEAKSMSI